MKRRDFLKLFGKGAAVAVAVPAVLTGLAQTIADAPVVPKYTDRMVEDAIRNIMAEGPPSPDYILYTGRQGYDDIQKALKDYVEAV